MVKFLLHSKNIGKMIMALGAGFFLVNLNNLPSSDESSSSAGTSMSSVQTTTQVVKTTSSSRRMIQRTAPTAPGLNTRRHLYESHVATIPSKIGSPDTVSSYWKNDHNLVHVISTRFMQHQGHLNNLGMARVDLFETFTVPSLMNQSNQQYLWLIWTDANLEVQVRRELFESISHFPNAVVLALEQEPDSNLRDLYGHSWDVVQASVIFGDVNLLAEYFKASHSHLLLETSLDADDAFSATFVESVQGEAAFTIGHNEKQLNKMEVFCPEMHAEWRVFQVNENSVQDENEVGHLVHIHDKNFCIKSGLTAAYHIKASARRLSPCSEDEHPQCKVRKLADRRITCDGNDNVNRKKQRVLVEDSVSSDLTENDTSCDTQVQLVETEDAVTARICTLDSKTDMCTDLTCPEGSFFCNGETSIGSGEFGDFNPLFKEFDFGSSLTAPNMEPIVQRLKCKPAGCTSDVVHIDVTIHNGQGGRPQDFTIDYYGTKDNGVEFCDPYDPEQDYLVTHAYADFDLYPGGGIGVSFEGTIVWDFREDEGSIASGRHTAFFTSVPGVKNFGVCVAPTKSIEREEADCRRKLRLLPSADEIGTPGQQLQYKPFEASVLMARTPTAAGMKNVMPRKNSEKIAYSMPVSNIKSYQMPTYGNVTAALEDPEAFSLAQGKAWSSMERNFGVSRADVVALRERLDQNMENILVDAFAGQCTPGHSCKEMAKRALGQLLDKEHLLRKA